MIVLFETAAGYALFKILDENRIQHVDNLYQDFDSPERASKIVKLKHFQEFFDTTEALAATTSLVEGKLSKSLKKLLKKEVYSDMEEKLLVSDPKLANTIKDKLNISCVSNTAVNELFRCIRSQMDSLIGNISFKDVATMSLGLSHSLSRYKLKFSPDRIDTMIVQAINLLEDLDKELNNYIMRCREWYGWHFPELGKILTDHVQYVKTVKLIGTRDRVKSLDLSELLPEDLEERIKDAAEVSVGTEISVEDKIHIHLLCDQILETAEYRDNLNDYLKSRMMAIAPNLTVLLGELVGARLISNAGSLSNLAKCPSSTLQILGAEKALFRALKTKRETPKYGLIYHSHLIGQAGAPFKGKMARMLAAKASLAARVDAFGDITEISLGAEHKVLLEKRLRMLEEGALHRVSGTSKAVSKFQKYYGKTDIEQYPTGADSTIPAFKRKYSEVKSEDTPVKKKIKTEKPDELVPTETETKSKKKKRKSEEPIKDEPVEEEQQETETKSKKKKRKSEEPIKDEPVEEEQQGTVVKESKKKKKKSVNYDEVD